MSLIRVVKKLNTILSNHQRIRIIELAILMIIGGFLELASVSLVLPFMNAVIDSNNIMEKWYVVKICEIFKIESSLTFLTFISVVLACVYIAKNVYLVAEFGIQYKFTYGNMLEMQKKLLNEFLHKPYEYYLNINSGEIIRIISNDVADVFYILLLILEILTEVIVSMMIIISLLVITPLITGLIATVLIIIVTIIVGIVKPMLYRAGVEYQNASAGMNKWILQAIQGIKEIRIANKEEYFQDNFENYGYQYVKAHRKDRILEILPKFIIEAASMSSMFFLVAGLIYGGNNLNAILPVLTAVAMAAIRLLPSVNRISQSMAGISYREARLDRLLDYVDKDKVNDGIEGVAYRHETEVKRNITFNEKIEMVDVSYHYPNTDTDILSNASLVIKKGESIGLVGPSGSGKTTTIDIILGLLNPTSGSIFVDGVDIRSCKRIWNAQIGYIPQNIFMLDGSIKSNIAFGVKNEDVSEERVWNALREASLETFVESLPEKLDTQIGERGVRLSGGQRQRIGIARTLYSKPNVLIFDEATSALDNETEADVIEAINELMDNRTMIIIAHRLTTIEKCNHVYRVQDGKIIQER